MIYILYNWGKDCLTHQKIGKTLTHPARMNSVNYWKRWFIICIWINKIPVIKITRCHWLGQRRSPDLKSWLHRNSHSPETPKVGKPLINICGSHKTTATAAEWKRMKKVEASGTRRASEPVDQKRAPIRPRYLCSSGLLLSAPVQFAGVRHAAGGFPDDSEYKPGTRNWMANVFWARPRLSVCGLTALLTHVGCVKQKEKEKGWYECIRFQVRLKWLQYIEYHMYSALFYIALLTFWRKRKMCNILRFSFDD